MNGRSCKNKFSSLDARTATSHNLLAAFKMMFHFRQGSQPSSIDNPVKSKHSLAVCDFSS